MSHVKSDSTRRAPQAVALPGQAPTKHQGERLTGEHTQQSPLDVNAGRILKRCYERVCSAIFDGDGDCMRF